MLLVRADHRDVAPGALALTPADHGRGGSKCCARTTGSSVAVFRQLSILANGGGCAVPRGPADGV